MIELHSLYKAIKHRLRVIYAKGLDLEEIEMELRLDIEQVLQLALSEDLPELCNYYDNCDNDTEYAYIDEEKIDQISESESEGLLDIIELMETSSLEKFFNLDDDSEE
tara:strand:+ start:525 stop:848 length:324 start_codon:yes stop_codon:yes gene_type:complete